MSRIVGIDLGTTNSEIAIVENGRPFVIPDENGDKILPSFVGISPSGELLVGQPAKNQYVVEPENTIKSIKRKMGTDEKVRLGDKYYTPQEISSFILRRLKEIAERYLGEKVERAVITVPAYFTDLQRQATIDAGEIAGLDVVRIINEPTAAALVYNMKDRDEDDIRYVMVYDLGGGTFDVSIVEMESGVVEVRASHGNTRLGGDDFDQKIIDYVADWFESEYGVDLRKDRKALARLMRAAENAKILLSDRPFANISEESITSKDGQPLNL
ncbi:TPA: heat-shock protein Hsp70, partial [Candidatus Poribacteria bacterium]|nr:heat-shock protein Hsp70 [Candidatus Poribacteria bacterium]